MGNGLRLPDGREAQVAETTQKGLRLIVRRTRLTGKQADLFPNWRHHCCVTSRSIPTLVADTDHRDHATSSSRSATGSTKPSATSPPAGCTSAAPGR